MATGELTERIGEIVLDGSERWEHRKAQDKENTLLFQIKFENRVTNNEINVISNEIIGVSADTQWSNDIESVSLNVNGYLGLRINKIKLTTQDINGLKEYLSQNPITIQYKLETESIKTVDLSTSGNWEKVVLDGKSSENWQQNTHSENFVQFEGYSNFCLFSLNLPFANRGLLCDKLPYYNYDLIFRYERIEGISDGGGYRIIFVRVKTEKLPTNDVAGFKQWLSQNPIEVSYMLSSNKDSTKVKQPIFFKDGHIQLSSGAYNLLIPTLDYQAKTSNSYVMDLMKTNTKYTMKAKSASGTFTIDGTSYDAETNGTFTSPSSMTNKLLIMSDNTNEEVMIIEGDATDKTIPYFEGMQSVKMSILCTTGKNLFHSDIQVFNLDNYIRTGNDINTVCDTELKPSTTYTLSWNGNNMDGKINLYSNGVKTNSINIGWYKSSVTFTTSEVENGFSFYTQLSDDSSLTSDMSFNVQLEEGTTATPFEPYKSNILSASEDVVLRGIGDVQDTLNCLTGEVTERIGEIVLNGSEKWGASSVVSKRYSLEAPINSIVNVTKILCICDKFPSITTNQSDNEQLLGITITNGNRIMVNTNYDTIDEFKQYLQQNPITVQYQLATESIKTVDLSIKDQDGNEIPKPKSYDEVTHFSINSLIPPIVEVEVQTSNQEDLESLSDTIDEIENQQDKLMTTSEEQEDGVQSVMLGLTEVFEESEEL